MQPLRPAAALTCFLVLSAIGFAADAAAEIKGFAPVSISSANYRATPREQLLRAVEGRGAVNPAKAPLQPLAAPQHFIFMPGEIFESDLTYEQVTGLLTPALAKKNYINAADEQGLIREPTKVTLVLRISYGDRLWRLPTVRPNDITWADGMIPRPRGRGLHNLGGEAAWDHRAGGNDETFAAVGANAANAQSFGFGSGAAGGGAAASSGSGAAAQATLTPGQGTVAGPGGVEYGSTREFHLIVVDAFNYQELKKEGKAAKRLWSTFVSAPREPKQKFSDLAATLIRNAVPFFGETSDGLQVYTDVRAEVKIGEMIEVK